MTDQPSPSPDDANPPPPSPGGPAPPPPPGGGYPPPPLSAGGYAPPPPGPVIRGLPPEAYTSWLARAGAFIIDYIPYVIIVGGGWLVLQSTVETACLTDITPYDVDQICASGYSSVGVTTMWVALLVGLAYLVWNYGYRQGITGSSIGKTVMQFKVVGENTGQPIGFGMSVVRQIAHLVDAIICYIGYLFPLWDAKRQTLADKIMSTVCLPIQPAPPGAPSGPGSG
ncbi:MAG: RDD family protein [Mycobacterium sp.]